MRRPLICAGVGKGARLKGGIWRSLATVFLLGLKYAGYRIMWLATTCSRYGVTVEPEFRATRGIGDEQ